MTTSATTTVVSLTFGLLIGACALTSRSEPMRVRYFSLDDAAAAPTPAAHARSALELRLGRVEASDTLSNELAVRTSRHELEYREDERWTEKPDDYLRRALERSLFQERGLVRVYSGVVPTLDVELTEFEEVAGSQPKARLRAVARLHDDRRGLCQETLTVERPIAARGPEHVEQTVGALSDALHSAVEQLSQKVVACLSAAQTSGGDPAQAVSDGSGAQPPSNERVEPPRTASASQP